jgi:hypothetical protein
MYLSWGFHHYCAPIFVGVTISTQILKIKLISIKLGSGNLT